MQSRYVSFDAKGVVSVKSEDVSADALGPLEVVIRNEASLVSAGTELALLHDWDGGMKYPLKPGYASIGRVVAAGDAVKDFAIGDRVFYAGKHAEVQRFTHGQDHQWGRLYPVPGDLPPAEAVFVCLAEIAMIGPVLSHVDVNDTVAVFGLGVIGNLAAQIYRAMGARVIGLDPVAQRCDLARAVGIEHVLSVPGGEQIAAVKKLTGDAGAEITVDAVGHSAVVKTCVQAAALFGQVIILGTPRLSVTGDLTEVFKDVHMRGITIRGAHMWQLPAFDTRGAKKTVPWAYRTIFDWMREGKVQVKPLRSHTLRVTDAPGVYDGLLKDRDKYWGVVFEY